MRRVLLALSALVALLLGPVPAFADEPVPAGNAAFTGPGAPVYPFDAVGLGCRWLGRCTDSAAALDEVGIPRYLSRRDGEAVVATCAVSGLARVRGFFNGAELADGWARVGDLRVRGPLDDC